MQLLLTVLATPAANLPSDGSVYTGVLGVVAIIGLVQVAKDAGLPTRFAPLLSVLLGIAAGVAAESSTIGAHDWPRGIFVGIILGLSACGLFAGVKTVASPSTDSAGVATLSPLPIGISPRILGTAPPPETTGEAPAIPPVDVTPAPPTVPPA